MYYWMISQWNEDVPKTDVELAPGPDGRTIYYTPELSFCTFPDSPIVQFVLIPFTGQETAIIQSMLFALEYTFEEASQLSNAYLTINSKLLSDILMPILEGEPYVSDHYVYHLALMDSSQEEDDSWYIRMDHITFYESIYGPL